VPCEPTGSTPSLRGARLLLSCTRSEQTDRIIAQGDCEGRKGENTEAENLRRDRVELLVGGRTRVGAQPTRRCWRCSSRSSASKIPKHLAMTRTSGPLTTHGLRHRVSKNFDRAPRSSRDVFFATRVAGAARGVCPTIRFRGWSLRMEREIGSRTSTRLAQALPELGFRLRGHLQRHRHSESCSRYVCDFERHRGLGGDCRRCLRFRACAIGRPRQLLSQRFSFFSSPRREYSR